MNEVKKIVIISDGTGRTAKRLMDAVLVQYHESDLTYSVANIFPQVRRRKELDKILAELDPSSLVIYSIISTDQADYFDKELARRKILHLNVLRPMLDTMSKFLGVHPEYRPGLLHVVDDRYYQKVDAIGYTVEHDDGRGAAIAEADIVLVGPSRSCKTPISMYLACNHGLRVANTPIFQDPNVTQSMLDRLRAAQAGRIVGLLMQPETLTRVREHRLAMLAKQDRYQAQIDGYCDIRQVAGEFRYCRDLYVVQGWHAVDVTRRGIEEVSQEIIELLDLSM
ncbi:MAG: pyruvate, phosphate dikinase/phosphoenolpyruvate synthase regulator [Candidatus Zixiibacteriota bacterium]